MAQKRLSVGSIYTVLEEYFMPDCEDNMLIEAYDACANDIENLMKSEKESEKNSKNLDDEEKMLIEAYDSCKSEIESLSKKNEIESFLDDGLDDLLNQSYDAAREKFRKRSEIPENMLHLVRNSKKEIEKNRLIAKIRSIERRRTWSAKFKAEISDFFYQVEEWPIYAIQILLGRDFGYSDRIGLASFLHGNGLYDADKALKIFQF